MTLAFAATMALVSFWNSAAPAQAQSNRPAVPTQQQPTNQRTSEQKAATSRFVPPPPPDRGAPGQREAAASRGGCPRMDTPLTALVPVIQATTSGNKMAAESVWSLTSGEHPTFWFYVPYSPSSLHSVEFVLQDEADNDIYRTPVKLPKTPGIIGLRLPSTSQPLEVGRMYHWFFKVYCTPQNAAVPIFVEGWVQRVAPNPSLVSQLKSATPQQRVALYAQNGIWFDALTHLAQLRVVQPKDTTLKANWDELLQSAGLIEMTSKFLVPCCTPAP